LPIISNLSRAWKLLDKDVRSKNALAAKLWLREQLYLMRRPRLPDPVFVVGCCRAGTSLVHETLALAHGLASLGYSTPEFWDSLFGPHSNGWESEAASARDARPEHRDRAFAYFSARLGPGRYVDKTCINTLRIPYLLTLFPKAQFVFIYRDGRDNVSSLIDGWRKGGPFSLRSFLGASPEPVAIDHGRFTDWCFFLPPGWRDFNRSPLEDVCAYQWVVANELALNAQLSVPSEQWISIRYEDVIANAEREFHRICERLALPFDGELKARCRELARHTTSLISGPPKLGKWIDNNKSEIERVRHQMAPMMSRLGYDIDPS
jgi:Sulfotransferase family